MAQSVQCILCKHYTGQNQCKAFDSIPFAILSGEFDHTKPYPNDNGIMYEPVQDEEDE